MSTSTAPKAETFEAYWPDSTARPLLTVLPRAALAELPVLRERMDVAAASTRLPPGADEPALDRALVAHRLAPLGFTAGTA